MSDNDSATDETEEQIEITLSMIKAGIAAYYRWDRRVEELEGLVIEIFEAMISASEDGVDKETDDLIDTRTSYEIRRESPRVPTDVTFDQEELARR